MKMVGGLGFFGLELPLTGKVNAGEGAAIGTGKDLLALEHTEEHGLGRWAREHRFTCETYRQSQHGHMMAAESYWPEKMGRKRK